jgi:hypothetical protein
MRNQALDQSRDLVWENGGVDSSRPGQRGRSSAESGAAEESGTPETGTEETKTRDDKKWDSSLRSLSWFLFFCPPSFCPPLPSRYLTTVALRNTKRPPSSWLRCGKPALQEKRLPSAWRCGKMTVGRRGDGRPRTVRPGASRADEPNVAIERRALPTPTVNVLGRRRLNMVVRGQTPGTAENFVGRSFSPPTSLASIGSVRHRILHRRVRSACRPLAVGRKAPASDGKLPLEDQPVRGVTGLRSDLPESESRKSEKTCGSSRETESSRRRLARIGFPDAGREKNACHRRGRAVG